MKRPVLVFDIETVVDTQMAGRLLGTDFPVESDGRAAVERYHLEQSEGRSSFPKPPFHRVVAIAVLIADPAAEGPQEPFPSIRMLESRSLALVDEAGLIRWFFETFEREQPTLVSFNGRGFDLPVLKYRAMVHGIQSRLLHDTSNKWENYGSRYAPDWHCDVLEGLTDFGASPRIRLDEVCAALGLPGKLGVDGSQVAGLYDQGRFAEIAAYCETDVRSTFIVYLRLLHHRARLGDKGSTAALDQVLEMLRSRASDAPHLRTFGMAWRQASGGTFGRIEAG